MPLASESDTTRAEILTRDNSREVELLLLCCRTDVDAERAERIRILTRGGIDWDYLIEMARANGVVPLLYRTLHAICPEYIPGRVLLSLRRFFQVNALHSRLLAEELLRLLRLFETNDIAVIPYRGPVLAADAYGELALRLYCDLDLVIGLEDRLRAGKLLLASGYIRAQHAERAHKFVRTEGRVVVELHWTFVEKHWTFRMDPERMWEGLRPVTVLNTTVPTFPPDDLLLLICMHGARDYWMRVGRICDVSELIRAHPKLDLSRILKKTRRLGCERVFLLGLHLAHSLLGMALPEDVRSRVEADPVVGVLTARIRKRLFSRERRLSYTEKRLLPTQMMERFADRVYYVLYWLRRDFRGLTPWGFRKNVALRHANPAHVSYPRHLALLIAQYGLSPMRNKKLHSMKEMFKRLV